MRALHLDGTLALRDRPEPVRAPGDALVRVRMAGICNTDLEIARGYMQFRGVLGHELVGEVVAHDDASWIGRRVAAEINCACGACDACARGLARHCPARTVMGILGRDGCFAERIALPASVLHALPDTLPDERAVFVEPLAAALEITEQIHVAPGTRVRILGDGKLGLLCAAVLVRTGADVTLEGRHARKLAIAESFGAHVAIAGAAPLARRDDLVIEATGSAAGLSRALDALRPRGTLVLKSTYHGATEVPTARLVIDEITLVGSRCGPFAPSIALLASGAVDPSAMLDAVLPLEEGLRAMERAAEPGVLKVALSA